MSHTLDKIGQFPEQGTAKGSSCAERRVRESQTEANFSPRKSCDLVLQMKGLQGLMAIRWLDTEWSSIVAYITFMQHAHMTCASVTRENARDNSIKDEYWLTIQNIFCLYPRVQLTQQHMLG